MSLDKAIASGKEHRKPYRKSRAFGPSCRNHGSCPWCEDNRKTRDRRRRPADEQEQLRGTDAEASTDKE